ncbi:MULTISPECIES: PAAR domain-containing protein [unclassified Caballeronia]|uniref:PAAR domain-containing protein n=1 Tax=unclassified Caballeronia TaxID=2646786 RepID=UPI002856E42E|nr:MULTISPECIES: PAAR domain-containing protein [unclassified Caballeronia]MDR5736936.1 PAAR domain-containing protein [Caballeronia sp. LZ016]MDR5810532.1 PAAR domain-containing protein [Caballeronia sp. LZ019]
MERATMNGRAQIVVGDTTSHGGKVVSGSPSSTWSRAEIPIARKGDKVTCPQCDPHVFTIAEGCEDSLDFGEPIPLEGHKTTCGAVLIAQASTESAA